MFKCLEFRIIYRLGSERGIGNDTYPTPRFPNTGNMVNGMGPGCKLITSEIILVGYPGFAKENYITFIPGNIV